jgi:hypothetical protein
MKTNRFIICAILALIVSVLDAQNVGITDKTGGITPQSPLHVNKSASTGTILQVTTGGTGEASTDGLILTRETSAFQLLNQENDTINIGGTVAHPGGHTSIEPDGTVVFKGRATVWDDLMVYPDATGRGGSKAPVWGGADADPFKTNGSGSQGVFLWMFSSSTEQEVYFTIQIPHSYKVGSAIYPHVHWTTASGTPSGTNVVWGLEYTVKAIGGNFTNTSIIYATSIIGAVGTPTGTGQHLINSFSSMDGTGLGISTVLVCRLFRATGHANDTFSNEVGLLGFDVHYEKDTEGSRNEFSK